MRNPEAQEDVTDILISVDGHPFELDAMVWHLNRDIQLSLSGLRKELSDREFASARNVLAYFACNYSAAHTNNMHHEYLRLLRFAKGQPISDTVMAKYFMTLGDKQWRLAPVRAFMIRWRDLGYDGLDLRTIDFIENLKIKGNPKGNAVKSLDPSIGPLSDIEMLGIIESMTQAYETGKLSLTDLAMSLLLSAFGMRPVQLTSLRVGDIVETKNKRGDPAYAIHIPRAKQTGQAFRANFKKRSVTRDIWLVLEMQKKFVEDRFVELREWTCPENILSDLPLFPNWAATSKITDINDLKDRIKNDSLHLRSKRVSESLGLAMEKLQVHSERTGEKLHLNSRRFRYTLGSRAAKEGYGPLIIAELLDHSDLQNVAIYTENLPEFAIQLNEALAEQLAPYAQAFAGKIINSRAEATRGNDPTSNIRDPSGHAAGNCAYHGPCGANVPIPCYTCTHFEAWVTGPHKAVHSQLLSERDRLIKLALDQTIVSALDRSILATAQVISACERRKNEADK